MKDWIAKVRKRIEMRVRAFRWRLLNWLMMQGLNQLDAIHPFHGKWQAVEITMLPTGVAGFMVQLKPEADFSPLFGTVDTPGVHATDEVPGGLVH